ncbi:MAG: thiamine pyrophosphate-dependent enzyme [Acidimicrobiales bacterium]
MSTADHLLKVDEIAAALVPELVIRLEASPRRSRCGCGWNATGSGSSWSTRPAGGTRRRSRRPITWRSTRSRSFALVDVVPDTVDRGWADRWSALDRTAAEVVVRGRRRRAAPQRQVTRTLTTEVPDGTLVMVSNSMPVRDLDAFTPADGPDVVFLGNRGASGIDGITSTSLGLAARHPGPVVLATGDLALLHDLGALFAARRAGLHVTVVCVDNDGRGIFSMLPIADRGDLPSRSRRCSARRTASTSRGSPAWAA